MAGWAWAAAGYGAVMCLAALTQPVRRRSVAFAASAAYTAVSLGAGSVASLFWVNLLVPGALLLAGYWLSGFFFRDPQAWLEQWLFRVDDTVAAERWLLALPRAIGELLELSYAADYVVIGGGAIYVATFGTNAVAYYWTLVLASELASFAPMPWLRSRPPRAIRIVGAPGVPGVPTPYLRRLNTLILDNASVQANTLPSGHVSGAVAAALGVMAVNAVAGWWLMAMAGLIAVGAIAGRYHYVVDCAAGAAVALAFWSLM